MSLKMKCEHCGHLDEEIEFKTGCPKCDYRPKHHGLLYYRAHPGLGLTSKGKSK